MGVQKTIRKRLRYNKKNSPRKGKMSVDQQIRVEKRFNQILILLSVATVCLPYEEKRCYEKPPCRTPARWCLIMLSSISSPKRQFVREWLLACCRVLYFVHLRAALSETQTVSPLEYTQTPASEDAVSVPTTRFHFIQGNLID